MSARALQRVAVRMLYDEPFLERVYADVGAATSGCGLTDQERSWLCTPDPRAWKVDPLRRSRSLAALVEEFAVSVALFVRTTRDATARLDAFFSSDLFHAGMQRGDSLARIFADWFVDQTVHRDLVRLEAALTRVRRAYDSGSVRVDASAPLTAQSTVVLAPGIEVLEAAAGTAEGFGAALAALRARPVVEAVLDRNFDVPVPAPGPGQEGILVDGRSAEPRLETLSAELARVLMPAAQAITVAAFIEQAAEHGADAEDCFGLLDSFAGDGTLRVMP